MLSKEIGIVDSQYNSNEITVKNKENDLNSK